MLPFRTILRKASSIYSRSFASGSQSLVDTSVDSKTGIATVTMQRPPVNGLNLELVQELSKSLDQLKKDRSRGAILTSALPTVFSGGIDILEMYRPDRQRMETFWRSLQDLWLALYGSPYPTAAAINGHSPAGGCLLAMSCEYRVMVEGKYSIGLNETALGIIAPHWFQATMRNTIPTRIAEMALTTGKMFTVEEAHQVGLIDEKASDKEDAISKCLGFLKKFEKISPTARAQTKATFRQAELHYLIKNKEQDLKTFTEYCLNEKVQKGLEAYLNMLKQKKKQ